MKKNFSFFLLIWFIAFVAYNAVFFITRNHVNVVNWYSYGVTILAFVVLLLCSYVTTKQSDLRGAVYHIPMIRSAFQGLGIFFVVSILFIFIAWIPQWIQIIILIILVAYFGIRILFAKGSAALLLHRDRVVKKDTAFLSQMIQQSEILARQNTFPEISAELWRVHDVFRYSDPVSCEQSLFAEGEISMMMQTLSQAIDNRDAESAKLICNNIQEKLNERNSIVKHQK